MSNEKQKEELLSAVFEDTFEPVDAWLLQDHVIVRDAFDTLDDRLLEAQFIARMPPKEVARLCLYDVISEKELCQIFYETSMSIPEIEMILEAMIFDIRQSLIVHLVDLGYTDILDIAERIHESDTKYFSALVDLDESSNLIKVISKELCRAISSQDIPLSAFQHFLMTLSLMPEEYREATDKAMSMLTLNLNEKVGEMIQDQVDFVKILKLSYLFALDSELLDRYQKERQMIEQRVLSTLLHFKTVQDIEKVIEPFPFVGIASVLKGLVKLMTHQNFKVRNAALHIKHTISNELDTDKLPKTSKVIRLYDLDFHREQEEQGVKNAE